MGRRGPSSRLLRQTNPISGYAGRDAVGTTRGKRAKQTQFRPTRPVVQTNPIWRRSNVRNKPNSPGPAGRDGGCGTRGVVQTNPIPALCQSGDRRSPAGGSATTPRCPVSFRQQSQSTRRCRAQLYKQTQFGWSDGGPEREMRKTNPIPARPGVTRPGGRGPNVQNEPNSPAAPAGTRLGGRGVLYKQTQFLRYADPEIGVPGRAIVRSKPNLAGRAGPRRAKCAKQSQMWARWDIQGTPCQGEGNRARQSQSPDCGLRILDCGFRKTCVPPSGLARAGCTNKPNWTEPICETKPIGRRGARPGDTPPFHYSIITAFPSDAAGAKRSHCGKAKRPAQLLYWCRAIAYESGSRATRP
jgi:hypothetical protein